MNFKSKRLIITKNNNLIYGLAEKTEMRKNIRFSVTDPLKKGCDIHLRKCAALVLH